jgi:hypothetical protein
MGEQKAIDTAFFMYIVCNLVGAQTAFSVALHAVPAQVGMLNS